MNTDSRDVESDVPADASQDVLDPLAHLPIVATDSTNFFENDRTLISVKNRKKDQISTAKTHRNRKIINK